VCYGPLAVRAAAPLGPLHPARARLHMGLLLLGALAAAPGGGAMDRRRHARLLRAAHGRLGRALAALAERERDASYRTNEVRTALARDKQVQPLHDLIGLARDCLASQGLMSLLDATIR
jgi:hypothetical protein